MLLLDHHPKFPYASCSRNIRIAGIPDEAVAATTHIVLDRMVFVVLDGDFFRVGHVDQDGNAQIYPEPAATPQVSTASSGFAYVTQSGDVCVSELQTGRLIKVSGPAQSVALSSNLTWVAIRGKNGTAIWNIFSGCLFERTDEVVLALSDDGRPSLTMSEAVAKLSESFNANGPFTLRGAISLDGLPFACFDSLYGTAAVFKDKISSGCTVSWNPGRWVVGIVRENDFAKLALQRLDQLDFVEIPIGFNNLWPEPVFSGHRLFSIEQVETPDGVKIPISRFKNPCGQELRSLVTVHGGFGLSLRPMSGVATKADIGDIVYAHVRGGGELGSSWAQAGRGSLKQNSLNDLCSVLRYEAAGGRKVSLLGTSHGGWLSILAAIQEPATVDRICVTSPITNLRAYLSTPLGKKHRAEFPADDELDSFDPIVKVAAWEGMNLPQLMIICGTADSTVLGQRFEEFAIHWRRAGGSCEIIQHSGGHYAPLAGEVAVIEQEQIRFLGIDGQ